MIMVNLMYQGEVTPFAMSPKDLKLIESIPQMMDIGVDSLKIEGRMKSIHYIATVVSVYRKVMRMRQILTTLRLIRNG